MCRTMFYLMTLWVDHTWEPLTFWTINEWIGKDLGRQMWCRNFRCTPICDCGIWKTSERQQAEYSNCLLWHGTSTELSGNSKYCNKTIGAQCAETDFKIRRIQQWLKSWLKPRNYRDVTAWNTVKIVIFRAKIGIRNDIISGKYGVRFITDRV